MRIIAAVYTYEDPEYLDAVIESFKWFPDKLYIVEGAWKSAQSYKDSKPRSGPAVYNIIDKHVDNKRVFLIQANEAGEREQRNVGLNKAKEEGADWHWFLDSDEVYPKSMLTQLKSLLQRAHPRVYGVRLRSFNFINSFKRWYDGDYNRISRPTPESFFAYSNDVQFFRDKRKDNEEVGITTMPAQLRYFHYNYVKADPEQFLRKMHFNAVEDPNFKQQLPNYGCKGHIYTIPSSISQYEFTGKHPKIMQSHPNVVNDIYNDGPLQFSQE